MSTNAIETKTDYEQALKDNGVFAGDRFYFTEGEGRQTRYFSRPADGGEKEAVSKGEAMDAYDEHGPENVMLPDDPDEVECRVCGESLGYITHSHLDAHDEGPTTVAEYREFVADADGIDPEDVPLASDDMYDRFASGGHSNDEETREKIAEKVRAKWESGEYDHLRGEGDGTEA